MKMFKTYIPFLLCFHIFFFTFTDSHVLAQDKENAEDFLEDDGFADPFADSGETDQMEPLSVSDPLEPYNRAMYNINDKFYIYVFNPVSRGYATLVPLGMRQCIFNFFTNLSSPVRIANCLLQGKWKNAGIETKRLGINSVFGVLGFFDQAESDWKLNKQDEDMGQTLAVYGMGSGFYFVIPFLGPRNARDTVGLFGDSFLRMTYTEDFGRIVEVKIVEYTNENSLDVDRYDRLKRGTLDPYVAFRDAYEQYRRKKINE